MQYSLTFSEVPSLSQSFNLLVNQGADYTVDFALLDENSDPIDLTGFTGASQLRVHYLSEDAIDFTVDISDNIVSLSLSAALTSNADPGRYVYDVELTSGNTTWRMLEGIVTIKPQITR